MAIVAYGDEGASETPSGGPAQTSRRVTCSDTNCYPRRLCDGITGERREWQLHDASWTLKFFVPQQQRFLSLFLAYKENQS